MSHIHVEPIACLKDNYAWVVRCGATGATALVDACVPSVLDSFEPGCHLEAVWSTHHHWDHVGGNLAVVQAFPGLEVFGHESDRSRIPGLTVGLKDGEHMSLGHLAVDFEETRYLAHVFSLFEAVCPLDTGAWKRNPKTLPAQ